MPGTFKIFFVLFLLPDEELCSKRRTNNQFLVQSRYLIVPILVPSKYPVLSIL